MTNVLKFNIADIVFSLRGQIEAQSHNIYRSYRPFLTNDEPEIKLKILYGLHYREHKYAFGKNIFDTQPNWRMGYWRRKYILEARDRAMILNSDLTSGDLYIYKNKNGFPFGYPLDQILMINLLARGRGILVHSCGLKQNNSKGLLFVGISGAGKSTTANLWKKEKDVTLLNDDRIIIRKIGSKFWMYGTPWHGDAEVYANDKAPLEKIFFLRHAKKNTVRKMTPMEACSRLVTCLFPVFWDKKGMKFTLSFCSKLLQKIPCYELGFIPDKSVLKFIRADK